MQPGWISRQKHLTFNLQQKLNQYKHIKNFNEKDFCRNVRNRRKKGS